MFNAIAAGVAGVALAAGSVLSPVPVTELGYQPTEASGGWFKIDDTARPFDVKFDADSVIFTGTGPLEMEAWRALDDKDLVFTLDKLDGVSLVLAVEEIKAANGGRLKFKGRIDRSSVPKEALRSPARKV